jgi:hypothetical protein
LSLDNILESGGVILGEVEFLKARRGAVCSSTSCESTPDWLFCINCAYEGRMWGDGSCAEGRSGEGDRGLQRRRLVAGKKKRVTDVFTAADYNI